MKTISVFSRARTPIPLLGLFVAILLGGCDWRPYYIPVSTAMPCLVAEGGGQEGGPPPPVVCVAVDIVPGDFGCTSGKKCSSSTQGQLCGMQGSGKKCTTVPSGGV